MHGTNVKKNLKIIVSVIHAATLQSVCNKTPAQNSVTPEKITRVHYYT
jgi:hypothetical protein